MLTDIIFPRGIYVRQMRDPPVSDGEEFVFLSSAGLDVRSVKFADRLCAVARKYPVASPAFVVDAVRPTLAQRRVRACDV